LDGNTPAAVTFQASDHQVRAGGHVNALEVEADQRGAAETPLR